MVDDADAVAEALGLVHVVRRERTVRPSFLNSSITSQSCRRDCGSSPVVGSSRKSSSGSPTSAQATARRCFWPPESFSYQASRFSSSDTARSTSSGVAPAREERAEEASGSRRRRAGRAGASAGATRRAARAARARRSPSASRAPRRRPRSDRAGPRGSRRSSSCPRRSGRAGRSTRPRGTSRSRPSTASDAAVVLLHQRPAAQRARRVVHRLTACTLALPVDAEIETLRRVVVAAHEAHLVERALAEAHGLVGRVGPVCTGR